MEFLPRRISFLPSSLSVVHGHAATHTEQVTANCLDARLAAPIKTGDREAYLELLAAQPIGLTDSKWRIRITSAMHWSAELVRVNEFGREINRYPLDADGRLFTLDGHGASCSSTYLRRGKDTVDSKWSSVAFNLRCLSVPLTYELVFSFDHTKSSVSAIIESVTCHCTCHCMSSQQPRDIPFAPCAPCAPCAEHRQLCDSSRHFDIGVLYQPIPNFGELIPLVRIWNTPPARVEISSED